MCSVCACRTVLTFVVVVGITLAFTSARLRVHEFTATTDLTVEGHRRPTVARGTVPGCALGRVCPCDPGIHRLPRQGWIIPAAPTGVDPIVREVRRERNPSKTAPDSAMPATPATVTVEVPCPRPGTSRRRLPPARTEDDAMAHPLPGNDRPGHHCPSVRPCGLAVAPSLVATGAVVEGTGVHLIASA